MGAISQNGNRSQCEITDHNVMVVVTLLISISCTHVAIKVLIQLALVKYMILQCVFILKDSITLKAVVCFRPEPRPIFSSWQLCVQRWSLCIALPFSMQ